MIPKVYAASSSPVIDYGAALRYLLEVRMGIHIKYLDLHSQNPAWDGYAWPAAKEIGIDLSIQGTRQERCVMAEEGGHCVVTPWVDHRLYYSREYSDLDFVIRSFLRAQVAKDERWARRWGTDALIPDPLFWAYCRTGPHELWEWCDHFEVEPWFMAAKMGFIRLKEHEHGRHVPKMSDFISR